MDTVLAKAQKVVMTSPKIADVVLSSTTPEQKLIALAATGNTRAFALLMRRNNQLLFRTARSIIKNDAEAEDIVQETYLCAWHALATSRAESALATWLVRITINQALGRLRHKSHHEISLETAMSSLETENQSIFQDGDDGGPEQLLLRGQIREIVEARIDLLPESFRTAFVLSVVQELSGKEVAQVLDLPEATVRSRVFRARGLLREGLAADMDIGIGEAFSFDGARCDRIIETVLAKIVA